MPFCRNCGKEVNEGSKFCPDCGTELNINGQTSNTHQNNVNSNFTMQCPRCGSIVPYGPTCPKCGSPLNQEKHTAAIILGYIFSIFIPIIGVIIGIYLLTRQNNDVHKHGIIMIVIAVLIFIISLIMILGSMSYYNSHYYYY